jgi:protein gp37
MELFGDWVGEDALKVLFQYISYYPQHTFIFLTKQPQNLIRWSPFPDNTYIGVSVTDQRSYEQALKGMSYISAKVRFLSFEPLLAPISLLGRDLDIFHWLIIGQQTPPNQKTEPKIEWLREIVEAADGAGLPVFLKDNLLELVNFESPEMEFAFDKEGCYRQEMPI